MEKFKIAITQIGNDATSEELFRQICEDPTMLELCTPVVYDSTKSEDVAFRDLSEGKMDALVLTPAFAPLRPVESVEIIVTDKTNFMPLATEPTAEDIVKLRDILERDFDLRSPRIAIIQEGTVQNPSLATQVTEEQGINTYGPYTAERFLAEDAANHFDGIIIVGDAAMEQRIIQAITQEAPACFFAGMGSVITMVYRPVRTGNTEEELTDISQLTRPIYTAIDIIRNRRFYDEARKNPLPKLFRDKREDRKKDDAPLNKPNSQNEEQF